MEHPLLYEINTRCWLRDLSDRLQTVVTLETVPDAEFASWQRLGFTHIWLMGVWTTGVHARDIALQEPSLRREYDTVLPGWQPADVAGSPYSIANYVVPKILGGNSGLAAFRAKLKQYGLKLILDFVPNHLGIDHPWVTAQPEIFVQSSKFIDGTFAAQTVAGPRWLAHGKDPFFAPWTDVAQIDYRRQRAREEMQKLLLEIAALCDGVRCDMAMLLLNEVFAKTWAHLPTTAPGPNAEFWSEAIPAVKCAQPGFIFLAEVYWGLEGRLQAFGFDFTYDKALYDDLIWRNHWQAHRRVLEHPADYLSRSVHFLENHDEHRVAEKLAPVENRAAALAILSLPGLRFLHEGQLQGARIKLPVQLGRKPSEPVDAGVLASYEQLLTALKTSAVGHGEALVLTPRAAWDGNPSAQNFIVVQWQRKPLEFDLVVVNLAAHRSQCYVAPQLAQIADYHWKMTDLLSREAYVRVGSDIAGSGLYLDLPAHGAQIFQFERSQ